jgi:regulatory protein
VIRRSGGGADAGETDGRAAGGGIDAPVGAVADSRGEGRKNRRVGVASPGGREGRNGAQGGGTGAEVIEATAAAGGESAARRIALDALSRSARTRRQLEALLERKGVAADATRAVLDRFEEVGLLDDMGYAEAFVESRHRFRGQGGRAIAHELRRRGVADGLVAQAVESLDADRQFATACRVAQARLDRLGGLAPEVKVRRLAGLLARKGYSGEIAARAIRHVLDSALVEAEGALGDWADLEDR